MNKTLITSQIVIPKKSPEVLKLILQELRLLRNEVSLLFPKDHLEDYAHPERIERSFEKAIKKYPSVSLWK